MKASIVDLRYKTAEVLKALDRNECVTVLYHGKEKGIIQPIRKNAPLRVKDHPFFGMKNDTDLSVQDELNNIRKARYDF